MPTNAKSETVTEIKTRLAGATGVIMADYRGLTVREMQDLRAKVRDAGGELKVYKNTLAEIAVRELALPSMDEFLAGPTAFVFADADPVGPTKAMVNFAKEHKALEVKGGLVQNALVDAAAVKAIASLPSREELIAKLLATMLNPMASTVRILNAPVGAFARALNAIAQQKEAAAA
ncbi:MAG TPA: 50S ribosomal protein L10 [Coriobacteriia bacterium]|nr:50S ribosomal protein L10 [Coriobacteriia bacterium]